MKLSILIPVLNEEKTISSIIDRLLSLELEKEIIVIDDGSTDGTGEVVRSYSDRGVKLVRHDKNRGKGAAIISGLVEVTGDVVVIQDGDLEYDPGDFIPMMAKIEAGADVVYGSRVLGKNAFSYRRFYFGGRLLSILANALYGAGITDEPTCYKMFRTSIIKKMDLKAQGFEFCPEVTAKAKRLGYQIVEIPIKYSPRSIAEGKKIRWWDGVIAIATLFRYRFWRPKPGGRTQRN